MSLIHVSGELQMTFSNGHEIFCNQLAGSDGAKLLRNSTGRDQDEKHTAV